ncbi:MAG: gamma-glutamylcyclotransferase [Ruminococcus sp.]|nr:gamma-glutamylcyclotransferase [Ruminococcus sp.]
MPKYYIAYGSNLNVRQMARRCPTAKPIGTAVIHDYELLFKGSKMGAYLTIERKKGGNVPVAVWEVTDDDEKRLDRYEGYPAFYYKTEMKLPVKFLKTGETKTVTAFVYIMHEDRKTGIPSETYTGTCAIGYMNFGFDMEFLDKALKKSTKGYRK